MINKLMPMFRSKLGLAVVGGLLFAVVGATIGLAVTGATAHLLAAGQTPSPAQCASDDHSNDHTSTPSDVRVEADDQGENQHAVRGTITSVDTANSSFVITQCNGVTTTVEVSTKTTFGHSVRRLADLKVGFFVDVEGTAQSNGRFTANRIHVEENGSDDEHDGADSDDHDSGTRTPATGAGG
jgi:hypothetical protein